MRKTLLVFASLSLFGLGLVGLAFRQTTLDKADFTYVSGAEPKTLDPHLMTGQIEGRFGLAMFEGLTYWDAKTLNNAPGMAERWDISEDERTWTFYFRDAKWSNGDPVTAHDFVWSWKRALDPMTVSEYYYMLTDIVGAAEFNKGDLKDFGKVGIKALDDKTLQVKLKYAVPYFLDLTSFYTLCPVHRKTVEEWEAKPVPPGAWTLPGRVVVNGPFQLDFWTPNDRLRLRKNPDYWNPDSIRLETIDALSIEDSNAALNTFLVGTAQWNNAKWPPTVNDKLKESPYLILTDAFITYYYRFNTTRKPVSDPRVRRAICMAIDRKEIVENVLGLGESEAYTYVPPGIEGYVPPPGLKRDLEMARKLLADAGYPGGKGFPEVEILYNTDESHRQVATVISKQLEKSLGITIKPYNQEWQSYQADTRSMNYDVARAGWIGDYLDPNTFLDMWITDGGNNQTGYSNKLYDRLYKLAKDVPAFVKEPDASLYGKLVEGDEMRRRVDAARGATDKAERRKLTQRVRFLMFKEMERLICEIDCPIMCIYFYVTKNLVKPEVGGFYAHLERASGPIPNVRDLHPLRGFFIKEKE